MFGGDDNKDPSMEFMQIMAVTVMFLGTILVMAYKGADKITKWGMAKHRDRKERERISKL